MNKTIIININGIVFHIEEDAYEILKNYMTDVKRHFATSADSLEITTDIENRIAEMFSEILTRDGKQVIIEQDVNLVVEQMGTVADFESADKDAEATTDAYIYGNREGRRLFRDADDHLLGGVCAGIANYFDINPVWIRLAFALFSPVGGTGIILYIILWIVVPKAVTRADRMAMKGEKQDLKGFKRNLEEEMSSVRENFASFGNEARPFVYQARDFVGDFFHHLGMFLRGTGKILLKLFAIALLMACFAGIVAMVVALVAAEIVGKPPVNLFPFSVLHNEDADRIFLSAFVVASIPVLSIMLLILKGVFNVGGIGKSTATVILAGWLCAVGVLAYYATKVGRQFKEEARFVQTINLKPTKNNVYYLKLNDIKYFTHDDSLRLDIKNKFNNVVVTEDNYNRYHDEPRSVNIRIERSEVNHPILEEEYTAKGANYEAALFNARNTSYIFKQTDTLLSFDYALRKRPNISWHDEEITLTLKVPLNSTLIIDQNLENYLNDVRLYDCKVEDKREKANNAVFIMTDNGPQCKIDTLVTVKKDTTRVAVKADSVANQ